MKWPNVPFAEEPHMEDPKSMMFLDIAMTAPYLSPGAKSAVALGVAAVTQTALIGVAIIPDATTPPNVRSTTTNISVMSLTISPLLYLV